MKTYELIDHVKELDLPETYDYINRNVSVIRSTIEITYDYAYTIHHMEDGGKIRVGYDLRGQQWELVRDILNKQGELGPTTLKLKQFTRELHSIDIIYEISKNTHTN